MRVAPLLACALLLAGAHARAADIAVLFTTNVPPYVLAAANPPAGMELELFRAALAVRGHAMRPLFVERDAVPRLLRQDKADAAQRGAPTLHDGDGVYYAARATVDYADVAITLKRRNLGIYSVADLRGVGVVAFPGARQFLGAEFEAVVKHNRHYVELADEQGKLAMLLEGSAAVYVGDVNVFRYLMASVVNPPETVLHYIFLPTQLVGNNAVFRDRQVRDDFDAGLKAIRESGQYQQILRRYLR